MLPVVDDCTLTPLFNWSPADGIEYSVGLIGVEQHSCQNVWE